MQETISNVSQQHDSFHHRRVLFEFEDDRFHHKNDEDDVLDVLVPIHVDMFDDQSRDDNIVAETTTHMITNYCVH